MTKEEIIKLIKDGERIDVELKESKSSLNKDVYDTVCSFNNRSGGHIILGVNNNKEIIGINLQQYVLALDTMVDITSLDYL